MTSITREMEHSNLFPIMDNNFKVSYHISSLVIIDMLYLTVILVLFVDFGQLRSAYIFFHHYNKEILQTDLEQHKRGVIFYADPLNKCRK